MNHRIENLNSAGLHEAECLFDPELHDGPTATIESEAARAARTDVARQVCSACPVQSACAALATRNRPTSGIWAGWTVPELAALPAETAVAA